ncbi:DUF3726 domain-containing protein [Shimia aestuarii]|uniref:DUF3726 domain-containing protein n=1 Tax=Shimia aestuarii TaxID=254406 RepID=A0A1I4STB9_9RHOB|nr:DUF3726 domain-containing protein [Shimia aestuarii]SFM67736.1 Protein of unknown function [Shimia aestuarii]
MTFSLNEVEAMAKKATRGAGYPWGLAEEASKATRWLCAQGIDGVAVLARVLARRQGCAAKGMEDCLPCADCPIGMGLALSDEAAQLVSTPKSFEAAPVPVFLLPFAAMAARRLGTTVMVRGDGFEAVTNGARLSLRGAVPVAAAVQVMAGGELGDVAALATRATPDPEAWDMLSALAHRTYAPATEESRLLGAGAGTTDND